MRRPFYARARQSESYRFLSLSFFVCVLESPPVGCVGDLGLELDLAVLVQLLSLLPLALIFSFTSPAAPTVLLITAPSAEAALTPLPETVSSPGLGTSTVRVAVPLRRRSPSPPP